jgi:MoaA/NifB/PqqE/SkfB family radical SAM enzyme
MSVYLSTPHLKSYRSEEYNYRFDKQSGCFERWGRTRAEDPVRAPFPEILDIEISTRCHAGCPHCYKSNTGSGEEMTPGVFRQLLEVIPDQVTQVALGIGDLSEGCNLWECASLLRARDVIPNVTINGWRLTPALSHKLASVMGAVAVSYYDHETCLNAVASLSEAGLRQVNIHYLLSSESVDRVVTLLDAIQGDPRLRSLNAVVFLVAKPKGRGLALLPPSLSQYQTLVRETLDRGIRFGFDSCSGPLFLKSVEGRPDFRELYQVMDCCESGLFSLYLNIHGQAFPCSFTEGTSSWEEGIDCLAVQDFSEVWESPRLEEWRSRLLSQPACACPLSRVCRVCPVYSLRCRLSG